jgi:hypothetical protein
LLNNHEWINNWNNYTFVRGREGFIQIYFS